jgi:hypothetical protein
VPVLGVAEQVERTLGVEPAVGDPQLGDRGRDAEEAVG